MKILVSDKLDSDAVQLLRDRGFEVIEKLKLTPEQLAEEVPEIHGWIVRSGTQVTGDLIEKAPLLRAVGRAGVGVDNVDIPAATRQGVAVLNTPTGNTMAAVEHAMALLLSMVRQVPLAHHSMMTERKWERSKFMGVELYGKTIGILGLGKIGSRVATRCRGFEMTVLAYDPYLSSERAQELGVERVTELEALLARCDYLSIHLPKTEETHNLLNAERLALCPAGVRIVNCARGGLIDEQALTDALISGHVGGAALDVFENEPPFESPLMDAPNLVATPHLGASTVESQRKVGMLIAEQIADALDHGVFREALNIPVRDWATFAKLQPQLQLAERMGMLAQQFVDGSITRVEVEYQGQPFDEIPATNNSLLKGLLMPIVGDSVNAVNAPLLAHERGIELVHTQRDNCANYNTLLRLKILADGQERTFSATSFADNLPRIVELDGFELEFIPQGTLLVFVNLDRPGLIGNVGTVLGKHGVNIGSFTLGRTTRGGDALAVLHLDDSLSKEVQDELAELEAMKWIKQISFQS